MSRRCDGGIDFGHTFFGRASWTVVELHVCQTIVMADYIRGNVQGLHLQPSPALYWPLLITLEKPKSAAGFKPKRAWGVGLLAIISAGESYLSAKRVALQGRPVPFHYLSLLRRDTLRSCYRYLVQVCSGHVSGEACTTNTGRSNANIAISTSTATTVTTTSTTSAISTARNVGVAAPVLSCFYSSC